MPQTTRLYLIRHGSTALTAEDRFAGETNVPLSDEGRSQSSALARRLASVPLDALYASPMDRTRDTASFIALPHPHLDVQFRPGLREMSHGHWEGKTRMEVLATYPDEVAAWDNDPYTFAPKHGETGLAVTARAIPVIKEICDTHIGGHIAIVSHKATIRLILSTLLGFDPRRYRDTLDQSPCALNIVDSRGATAFRLTLLNDTSHYSGSVCNENIPPAPAPRLSPQWT